MLHSEYIRIVPGADTAVLFIHGICGTPVHFRELIALQDMIPDAMSVYNMRLDGHGGTASDFAATSGEKWRKQVFSVYEMLARDHDRVLVVGHSMGTLFGIQLAVAHPEKVKKLFLLAVPMRPWLKLTMIADLLRMVFGKPENTSPPIIALRRAAGIQTTRNLWQYIPWIPRFLDLFLEIRRTEQLLPEVVADCVCYQSQKDELVLRRSEKILERNRSFRIIRLKDSSHFYYSPEDGKRIMDGFRNWIDEKTHD